jgi:hypothetical protein
MDGRAFLDVAKRSAAGATEADWRDAGGRAYYSLFLEARDALRRWGFVAPRRDPAHAFVRLKLIYATQPDLKGLGFLLEERLEIRTHADYKLDSPGRWFTSPQPSEQAVLDAEAGIRLLDQIEADPARRAAAIASIKP